MGVLWKGPDRCYPHCGFALQPRNTVLGECIIFIASSKQTSLWFRKQTLHHLLRLPSVYMTLRNGPCREQSGLCLIDKVSKICRSPGDLWETVFLSNQYRHMQEFDGQLGRKAAFIQWFQVQYSVPRTMVVSMCLIKYYSKWQKKLLESYRLMYLFSVLLFKWSASSLLLLWNYLLTSFPLPASGHFSLSIQLQNPTLTETVVWYASSRVDLLGKLNCGSW